jgi:mercuric reductase
MPTTDRLATLEVAGMTCDSCESHVATALGAAGARDAVVDWRQGKARFRLPADVGEEQLRAAVEASGYHPGELRVSDSGEPVPLGSARPDYDLLVLGAGSAAFAAAIKARDAGHRVALVEAGTLGGTCVNVGCVPSKVLLRAGEAYWAAGHHPFAGIGTSAGPVDLAALVAQKDDLVAALRQEKYADLIDAYGFELLAGRGRFVDAETIDVDGRRLRSRVVLVATGASPAAPPIPGLSEAGYRTSTTALELKERPDRLAVIGANAVGLELGQFFAHLGSAVTFLDVAERIAPFEEPEASAALTAALLGQGAVVYTGAHIVGVERRGEARRVRAVVEGREVAVEADEILVATGRRPNTEGLGLDAAGIEVDARGAIVVDDQLRTTHPGVWAAGDVTGAPQFVYVSAYQGALAAENALLGAGRSVDLAGLPRVIFTTPALAAAGLTEDQARGAGYDVRTSVLPASAIPRALVNRDPHSVVKLVSQAATNRLLGATVVGEGAGEVIQSAVLAIRYGITTTELAGTFHPYLTMAEGLKLAAQTFTRDVARLSCCAA